MEEMYKRFEAFVNGLTEEEVRKELMLAYTQMELCNMALHGNEVEPVAMKDNGESTDLELFYQCKKVANENAYLNDIVSNQPENNESDGTVD